MGVVFRGKDLEVLEVRTGTEDGIAARVRATSWAVDYWVITDCLRRV